MDLRACAICSVPSCFFVFGMSDGSPDAPAPRTGRKRPPPDSPCPLRRRTTSFLVGLRRDASPSPVRLLGVAAAVAAAASGAAITTTSATSSQPLSSPPPSSSSSSASSSQTRVTCAGAAGLSSAFRALAGPLGARSVSAVTTASVAPSGCGANGGGGDGGASGASSATTASDAATPVLDEANGAELLWGAARVACATSECCGDGAIMEDAQFLAPWLLVDPAARPVSLFGVCDGHGGPRAAAYAAQALPQLVRTRLPEAWAAAATSCKNSKNSNEKVEKEDEDSAGVVARVLRASLLEADREILHMATAGDVQWRDGATALVVALLGRRELVVANVGDCRAVVGAVRRDPATASWTCTPVVLTRDHHASEFVVLFPLFSLHLVSCFFACASTEKPS